jgi:predicted peroxiredoxin
MIKVKRIISMLVLIFFIAACATTMDYKVGYLTARDSFNGALRNYIDRVKAMPAGPEKDQTKKDFNPIWKDAEAALDTWGGAVKGATTDDPTLAIKQFTDAKNKLIQLGLKYFGDRLFGD